MGAAAQAVLLDRAMESSAYFPYQSEAARDSSFAYLDRLAAKQWAIPSEARLVPTSYGETFVRVSGPSDAAPLVLLPGAGTTSLMWAPNIKALSSAFRTFAVDRMSEFGRSICTRPLPELTDLLAWLNELLDALDLRTPVHMAGLSYGGALTAQFALHCPERVNKAVLLAPGNTVLPLRTAALLRLILAALRPRMFVRSMVRWFFGDMVAKDRQWADDSAELILQALTQLQRRAVWMPPVLTDAEWADFPVPALFLVGEHEVIYSAEKAVARLKRVAPQVRTEIVAGAGHDLTFVQAEIVNARMIDFLSASREAHAA